jgi:hypothetical protein
MVLFDTDTIYVVPAYKHIVRDFNYILFRFTIHLYAPVFEESQRKS